MEAAIRCLFHSFQGGGRAGLMASQIFFDKSFHLFARFMDGFISIGPAT
jgi:hypothetical protein